MNRLDLIRLILIPVWLVTAWTVADFLLATEYSTALVGLATMVGPTGVFIFWPVRRIKGRNRARMLALSARADWEHQAYLRGDPRGLYGQYPPR